MAQNPFDQLAKQYLEDFLSPIGQVTRNLEVPGEAKFVDVFFVPDRDRPPQDLGLLGRIVESACSLEPFRNAPSRAELRTCILKLIWLQETDRRSAKQTKTPFREADLPQLWILASTTTQPVLRDAGALPDPDWPIGVYRMPPLLKTTIVALDQLPETADTLWLRLLGKGPTQERAVRELLALRPDHPYRSDIIRLLASWKVKLVVEYESDSEAGEELMALSQAFLDWEQQTQTQAEAKGRQEGRQEGQIDGRLATLLLLLNRKVGPIGDRLKRDLSLRSTAQLDVLAIDLLEFTQLSELEQWLVKHPVAEIERSNDDASSSE
jgi:hypothetical protein